MVKTVSNTYKKRVTKIRGKASFSYCRSIGLSILMLFMFASLIASGRALALARGYTTNDTSLKQGMVVSLTSVGTQDNPIVQSADTSSADKVIGVVVSTNDNLITVGSASSQVFVAGDGQAKAYASDLNGMIKKDDLLVLSPFKGILMKANNTGSINIIGMATEDFPAASAQTVSAKDASGKSISARVALIGLNIDIRTTVIGISNQNWLQRIGRSITGHDVSELRIVSALAIFITLLIIEGAIIYGAVSSSLISIGRNPLAKGQIIRQLMRSVGLALTVLVIGAAAIAAIMWL